MKNRPWAMATSVMTTIVWNPNVRRGFVIAADCTVSSEQLAVQRLDVVDKPVDAVAREDERPAAIAHRSPAITIGEQPCHRAGESPRVTERRDLADGIGVLRAHNVADAADVRRDAGHACGKALDQRDWRAFV